MSESYADPRQVAPEEDTSICAPLLALMQPSAVSSVHLPDNTFDFSIWKSVSSNATLTYPNIAGSTDNRYMIIQAWSSSYIGIEVFIWDPVQQLYSKQLDITPSYVLSQGFFFAKAWNGSLEVVANETPGGGALGKITSATLQVLPNDTQNAMATMSSASMRSLAFSETSYISEKGVNGTVCLRPPGGQSDYRPFSVLAGINGGGNYGSYVVDTVYNPCCTSNVGAGFTAANNGFTPVTPIVAGAAAVTVWDSAFAPFGIINPNERFPITVRAVLAFAATVPGAGAGGVTINVDRQYTPLNLNGALTYTQTATFTFNPTVVAGGQTDVATYEFYFDQKSPSGVLGMVTRVYINVTWAGAAGSTINRQVLYPSQVAVNSVSGSYSWVNGPYAVTFVEGLSPGQTVEITGIRGYSVIPTARSANLVSGSTFSHSDLADSSLVEAVYARADELLIRTAYSRPAYFDMCNRGYFRDLALYRNAKKYAGADLLKLMPNTTGDHIPVKTVQDSMEHSAAATMGPTRSYKVSKGASIPHLRYAMSSDSPAPASPATISEQSAIIPRPSDSICTEFCVICANRESDATDAWDFDGPVGPLPLLQRSASPDWATFPARDSLLRSASSEPSAAVEVSVIPPQNTIAIVPVAETLGTIACFLRFLGGEFQQLPDAYVNREVFASVAAHVEDVLFSDLSMAIFRDFFSQRQRVSAALCEYAKAHGLQDTTADLARAAQDAVLDAPSQCDLLPCFYEPVAPSFAQSERLRRTNGDTVRRSATSLGEPVQPLASHVPLPQRTVKVQSHNMGVALTNKLKFGSIAKQSHRHNSVLDSELNPVWGWASAPLVAADRTLDSRVIIAVTSAPLDNVELFETGLGPYQSVTIESVDYHYCFPADHEGKPVIWAEFIDQLSGALAFTPNPIRSCYIHVIFPGEITGASAGLAVYAAIHGICARDVMFTGGYFKNPDGTFTHVALGGAKRKLEVCPHIIVIQNSFADWSELPALAANWTEYPMSTITAQPTGYLPVRDELAMLNYFRVEQARYLAGDRPSMEPQPHYDAGAPEPTQHEASHSLSDEALTAVNSALIQLGRQDLVVDPQLRGRARYNRLRNIAKIAPEVFPQRSDTTASAAMTAEKARRVNALLQAEFPESLLIDEKRSARQRRQLKKLVRTRQGADIVDRALPEDAEKWLTTPPDAEYKRSRAFDWKKAVRTAAPIATTVGHLTGNPYLAIGGAIAEQLASESATMKSRGASRRSRGATRSIGATRKSAGADDGELEPSGVYGPELVYPAPQLEAMHPTGLSQAKAFLNHSTEALMGAFTDKTTKDRAEAMIGHALDANPQIGVTSHDYALLPPSKRRIVDRTVLGLSQNLRAAIAGLNSTYSLVDPASQNYVTTPGDSGLYISGKKQEYVPRNIRSRTGAPLRRQRNAPTAPQASVPAGIPVRRQ